MRLTYTRRDGWHCFTSPDVPGLWVASPSLWRCLLDLWPSIRLLRRLNA